MKRAGGFTFIEVMIASVILIVVFILIYGTMQVADESYLREASLRTAQLNAQNSLDTITVEAAETGRGQLWTGSIVITPSNPANLSIGLVYLTARDASGAYVMSGVTPVWQNTVALIPLPALSGGTYDLVRYELAAPSATQLAATSTIVTVSATQVTIDFKQGATSLGTAISIPRTSGRKVLGVDMTGFTLRSTATDQAALSGTNVSSVQTTQTTVVGTTNLLNIMEIGVQIQVTPPRGAKFVTGYTTTIRGRN